MPRLPDVASTEELKELADSPYRTNARSLDTKVFRLQQKLYLKAKREPKFRFYSLFDRIYRKDVLQNAWCRVAANDGAPGVDGVRIKDLQKDDARLDELLEALHEDLRTKTYKPQPVKRVSIPKADGTRRPLGIPTVRDRVAQMAALLVLEPIFEADFLPCSHGFRPGRKAADAMEQLKAAVNQGRHEALDADLKSYFDTIPHEKLLACVGKRVTDRSVLNLIRLWLRTEVVEDGKPPSRPDRGTPQGGVLSPLLGNVYLHWIDRLFYAPEGPGSWANAKLIRYADDFVIIARFIGPRIGQWLSYWMDRSGLTLNRAKTQVVDLAAPGQTLSFLGFTLRLAPSRYWEGKFCVVTPSPDSVKRARANIRERTSTRLGLLPIEVVTGGLNQFLRGWRGYFDYGYAGRALRELDWYAQTRMKRFLKRRSHRPYRRPEGQSWYRHLYEGVGLVQMASGRRQPTGE